MPGNYREDEDVFSNLTVSNHANHSGTAGGKQNNKFSGGHRLTMSPLYVPGAHEKAMIDNG